MIQPDYIQMLWHMLHKPNASQCDALSQRDVNAIDAWIESVYRFAAAETTTEVSQAHADLVRLWHVASAIMPSVSELSKPVYSNLRERLEALPKSIDHVFEEDVQQCYGIAITHVPFRVVHRVTVR
jgi:hypothetical protein